MNKILFIINKNIYLLFLISILNLTLEGIIEPDDILPLEISPSYESYIGIKGTKFIFRFYIPNNLDKNGMPTMRGYGASNGQYIRIRFNMDPAPFTSREVNHSCSIFQIDENLNIPLIPEMTDDLDYNSIYCKINSFNNNNIISPGHNYKLIITLTDNLEGKFDNLISITIFTSSSKKSDGEIFDSGTFNHINIIPPYNSLNPSNPIANLQPINPSLNIEVETDFKIEVKIKFNDWFTWNDYIICLNLPKNQVNTENPTMKLSKPTEESNIEVPAGTINTIDLENDDDRKFIGFYLDNNSAENNKNDILLMSFSGFKTRESGLINEGETIKNNYIGIEIRYRNSYVICSNGKINFLISLGNVKFSVKHPETSLDNSYKFDVFRGGAFQIEFSINIQKRLSNKYFVIKQKESNKYKRVTFIASSCDFSYFNISSSNFNEIPKCHPIKNKNNLDSEDSFNGIFFYYPYNLSPNIEYKLKVWIFFDECGPEDNELEFIGDREKVEIFFDFEIYNKINKNKFGEKRIESQYIFLNTISTEKGIICYNTYMGEKNYQNGYLFDIDSYSDNDKLLYREYFNWNIYNHDDNTNSAILGNLFSTEQHPQYIYSKKNQYLLKENSNLLLVNKITLDSGNNEKLGQFFPMGLKVINIEKKILAIKGKFFIKLSKKFFSQKLDINGNPSKCYISWAFGSPSITEELSWSPIPKYYPKQKYNFITNSENYFENDPTALFNPQINNINNFSLESKPNVGWDDDAAEWSFGDDENLEDQIGDDSPENIYFGLADTCHYWTNLTQTITSLYTPIEIILGITGENKEYSRVMRFIKLFPEGGVWHDNSVEEGNDIFIRSNDFIIKNHFAYNKDELNENSSNEKGVCLIEILNGILDSQEALSNNFFLWIFLGSLIDTDYEQISSSYPVGNLADSAKAYGYSSQHSLHPNNFYAKPPKDQNSDISSPIYNLATSMNSIYQSATSGYLFYLGSLIVFYNKVKTNSFYNLANDPLIIPYYCPYYHSKGEHDPYSLGIFPSFIAGFGSFESMTNFGNKGFEKLIAKKINNKQLNVLMTSGIKIVKNNNSQLNHFYNTVKFINHYSNNLMTLDVWNSDAYEPCKNEYDSIDSFIFFFNEKMTELNDISPQPYIPNELKSITKSKRGNFCFYVYGKKFCTGLYGLTNKDLLLGRNTPSSKDKTPYLSINLKFDISQNLLNCPNSDKFCQTDLIAFWGISSNHDMTQYVTNFKSNSFLIDYNIYREYLNSENKPKFEIGQAMAFKNDPSIFIKIIFKTPFKTAISSNSILSFKIKQDNTEIKDAQCSVQSQDVNLPSMKCNTVTEGNIQCKLIDSSMKYNIFCYKLSFGSGKFSFYNFKIGLPSETDSSRIESLLFEDNNEYPLILQNSDKEPDTPEIQAKYITIPYNKNSYSKLELKIDLKRPAHPGMTVEIIFNLTGVVESFEDQSICTISLNNINSFSLKDIDIDEYWTNGNAIISNCVIEPKTEEGIKEYIIKASLDNRIYKVEKELSKYVYIYIWPFKAVILDEYIFLSVKVNDKNILPDNEKKIFFSNINQDFVSIPSCVSKDNLFSISMLSSNILGDLADYTFEINLGENEHKFLFGSINLAQFFFPNDINFECEECVKCYEVSPSGETTMITCNFEDINILNIFFSNKKEPNINDNINILITGIINPIQANPNSKIFVNLINIDSSGNRNSIISTYFYIGERFIPTPKIGRLRFFYVSELVSNQNPRSKANYLFKFGFDYANIDSSSSFPGLSENSLLYIYFPRDYHLYINENPTETMVRYYYSNGDSISFGDNAKILGRKIKITINKSTDYKKMKYIEILINNIKNPNKIISNTENLKKKKYTGYFKIVYLNTPHNGETYYYTTGINSNTFRSDYINDENLRTNEYNWYRGILIQTGIQNKNKFMVDILYNQKTYNFIFVQPGRYIQAHFITSSDNENSTNLYLNPSSTSISFESNSIVKTLEDKYILPSLYGEPFQFYLGVPCATNDGIYVVNPIISNTEEYIDPPSIIIYVRQIEKSKIDFIQDDLGISPLDAKTRIYYYLSDINFDDLTISWTKNDGQANVNKNIVSDIIVIPGKTYTNKEKKISNVFTTITIKSKDDSSKGSGNNYFFKSSNYINRCYQLSSEDLVIKESEKITHLNFESIPNYKLSDDPMKTSENDNNLLSNEIKFELSQLQPSFILCELYCPYKSADDDTKLLFLNYESMERYITSVKPNYFRKYISKYFPTSLTYSSLVFDNIIKGYQYNLKCIFQTTESSESKYKQFTLTSENLHSTYPPRTLCNTFYFISPITIEIKQKYINYCQYFIGKTLGYETGGCIICSDNSGKIISPGYSLYFPFICQNEQCYDKENSFLIDEMYTLSEEFNTNSKTSKYEFTICATSNRICSSQVTEENFKSAFNQFVNDIKITENVNKIFNIDYNDINYIIYSGFYQNMIYSEDNLNENDISIEFSSNLDKNGNAIWKASYNSEVNFNILCFWRIKISTYQTPTMEEMINCDEGDSFCGLFVANYGGHEYQIPDYKKSNIVIGEYTLYITCSHFVPSPIYFTPIKSITTIEITEELFSRKLINIKYNIFFLLLILLL